MFENNENLDKSIKFLGSDTYEAALTELKDVLKTIDSQGASLDNVLENVQRANQLVQHCKDKLRAIEKNVKEIL